MIGAQVFWYDEIDSTNEEALRRAKSGQGMPVWIASRRQTAGRGRLKRKWLSPDGNLFVTALFVQPGGVDKATRLSFAAALAVVDTCKRIVPDANLYVKWPNDVRSDAGKLCGILVESREENNALWVAVGIGLNIQHAPAETGQATVCLCDLGAPVGLQAEHVLDGLIRPFTARIQQARNDFAGLLDDWRLHNPDIGQTVTVGAGEARLVGIFEDLDANGGLVLRLDDGRRHVVMAGDVEPAKQAN